MVVSYLNNLTETKPILVASAGVTGGLGASVLQWLKLTADIAGSLGAILGCIVALLSIVLLVKQIRKN